MNFLQDVKFGIRMLFKSPGFTIVSVLTLGLGIGACAAIFSLVNALLIQPLPYADPDRIVFVLGWDVQNDSMNFNVSAVDYADWHDTESVFDGAEGYRYWSVNLTDVEVPQRLQGYQITPGMFSMLGVAPAMGRDFNLQEVASGADRVSILSHRIWQKDFQGDAGVLGQTVNLNDVPHTIIGVMPPRFEFPQGNFRGDIWAPIMIDASRFESRNDSYSMVAVARLKQDVPIEQAQARMDTIYETLARDYPDTNAGMGVRLLPFQEFLIGPARPALLALMGAVGFLLLIACANVANLLLVRSKSRQREIAIRAALGAGRLRLVRQLCLEHLILALLACGLGIMIAQWTLDILLGGMPEFFVRVMPALLEVKVDSTVLVFSAGIALVTGLTFSLIPAISATRVSLTDALKDGAQGTQGREKRRLSQTMVAIELALSVMLLVGAGLLMRSFGNLRDVNLGFEPNGVVSMRVSLPQERYPDDTTAIAFYDEFMQRVGSSPGVVQAGLVNSMPFSTSNSSRSIEVEGQTPLVDGRRPRSDYRNISPGYFGTIGMRLLDGRDFDDRDLTDSSPVAIVNETFVQEYLGGQAPIGVRIRFNPDSETPWREIIGVVNDIKHFDLTTEYQPELYVPYRQLPRGTMTLVARSEGDPMNLVGVVRGQMNGLDSNMPLFDVMTLDRAVGNAMFGPMITASLMSGFAIIAALLAAVGLYGLISFSVSQRHAEIGLRIALGASRHNVLLLVMRSGMLVTVGGLVVGFAMAFGLTQVLSSILYNLTPADPLTYAGVAIALTMVVLLAHYLPARKASHIDPIDALRSE